MNYHNFPEELRNLPQWVVWKYGPPRADGKRPKVPYNPVTGKPASSTDPDTWVTYKEALIARQAAGRRHGDEDIKGIGFMFVAGQGYVGIDLDDCFDPSSKSANEWARGIIDRLDSYTEVSPSYSGIHIIVKGNIPRSRKTKVIEMYQSARFLTVTGMAVVNGIRPIADRQDELTHLYIEAFGEEKAPQKKASLVLGPAIDDTSLIAHMGNAAKHGERFKRLWAGDWQGYGSQSEADIALCGILAYWTQGDETRIDDLFRQSGLYREKWDTKRGQTTYGAQTIARVMNGATSFYTPSGERKRTYRPLLHSYPYQWAHEEAGTREQMLQTRADDIKSQVARAIDQGERVTGIASPPGVGKSFTVAAWGIDQDIAYLVPRHEQERSVPTLQHYRIVQPPTAETCPNYQLHNELARAGYNTIFAHRDHTCLYRQQFEQTGSAVYQIAHAMTTYPATHRAIVVDEFNLTDWYTDQKFTATDLKRARGMFDLNAPAYRLLRAVQMVLSGLEPGEVLQGKPLFDAINQQLQGGLEEAISLLSDNYKATNRYPLWAQREDTDRVVLPHLWNTLHDELPYWQHGGDWNSYMRATGSPLRKKQLEAAPPPELLSITEPRRFQSKGEQTVPPLVILDATMHEAFLQRWAGQAVTIHRPEIAPPPETRHIGVRVARYGKRSLTQNEKHFHHVVNQVGFVLDQYAIDRSKAGLITFEEAKGTLGDALAIPTTNRLHFFASRGSNALEHCETLFIVGTPALPPDALYRYARAIYHDDPVPIVEASDKTETGGYVYQDRRVQELGDYITQAELTQCAHRNRPLRYNGRTVITFCKGDIDFLPLTDEVVTLPTLTATKAEQERLDLEAIERIKARGEKLTVNALVTERKMDRNRAAELVRRYK